MTDISGGSLNSGISDRVPALDSSSMEAASIRWNSLTKPRDSLGRLESIGTWLCGVQGRCPPSVPTRPLTVIIAGDHGIARTAGTSAYPPEVTAQMVRAICRGEAAVNALARQMNARVRVVDVSVDAEDGFAADLDPRVSDHRVRRGSGSIDREDAMTLDEAQQAFDLGRTLVDEEVDSGTDIFLLGDMGIGNTTPASVLVGLLAPADPAAVVGRGTGIDDETWMRKCAAIRDAMRRGRPVKGDPLRLLATIGGADLATLAGMLVQAAHRRTPVLIDGTVVTAAALIAHRIDHRSRLWWMASHLSTEPAHALALDRLDLTPLFDFSMHLGEASGALLALPIVQASTATLTHMRTFEEAGVDERT